MGLEGGALNIFDADDGSMLLNIIEEKRPLYVTVFAALKLRSQRANISMRLIPDG